MRGKYSEQQKIATDKFLKNNYESIMFRVRKGKRAKIQEMAEKMGYSVNALLEYLIDRESLHNKRCLRKKAILRYLQKSRYSPKGRYRDFSLFFPAK